MPIEIDSLIGRAIEATGLSDFGDPSYQEPLNRLIYSLNFEAGLNASGEAIASNIIIRTLSNRLKIEDWWKQYPELENEVISGPIIIIGMSRSGTTALSHMLAKDEALRSLLGWEAQNSVPPPKAETYWTDPRYLAAVEADANAPFASIRALHYDPPEAPVECSFLFNMEFLSTGYSTLFYLPSYVRWMFDADKTDLYKYHSRALKLLQSQVPGRWNLKAPQHAIDPEQLFAQYPDAVFVITHRNPVEAVASTSSLVSTLNNLASDIRRPKEMGTLTTAFFERMANQLVSFSRKHADANIVHIPYQLLVTDPMEAVQRVFAAADHQPIPQSLAAIQKQIEDKPQHSHGKHAYTMADFGLVKEELDQMFATYNTEFAL